MSSGHTSWPSAVHALLNKDSTLNDQLTSTSWPTPMESVYDDLLGMDSEGVIEVLSDPSIVSILHEQLEAVSPEQRRWAAKVSYCLMSGAESIEAQTWLLESGLISRYIPMLRIDQPDTVNTIIKFFLKASERDEMIQSILGNSNFLIQALRLLRILKSPDHGYSGPDTPYFIAHNVQNLERIFLNLSNGSDITKKALCESGVLTYFRESRDHAIGFFVGLSLNNHTFQCLLMDLLYRKELDIQSVINYIIYNPGASPKELAESVDLFCKLCTLYKKDKDEAIESIKVSSQSWQHIAPQFIEGVHAYTNSNTMETLKITLQGARKITVSPPQASSSLVLGGALSGGARSGPEVSRPDSPTFG